MNFNKKDYQFICNVFALVALRQLLNRRAVGLVQFLQAMTAVDAPEFQLIVGLFIHKSRLQLRQHFIYLYFLTIRSSGLWIEAVLVAIRQI